MPERYRESVTSCSLNMYASIDHLNAKLDEELRGAAPPPAPPLFAAEDAQSEFPPLVPENVLGGIHASSDMAAAVLHDVTAVADLTTQS